MAKFVLILIPICTFLSAQETASQPGLPDPAKYLAVVDAVILDAEGQAVTNLNEGDIRLFDNGKTQQIAFIRSNDRASAPPATIILFDLLNLGQSEGGSKDTLSRGTEGIDPLVQTIESAKNPENIYFYFLRDNGALYPVRALPGDANSDTPSAEPLTGHARERIDAALHEVLAVHPGNKAAPTQVYGTALNASYNALVDLGSLARSLDGRKTLIWITQIALPPDPLPELSGAFNRIHFAVYPVNTDMLSRGGRGRAPGNLLDAGKSLAKLTELTGGRYFTGGSINKVLPQSEADALASFQIGYYPGANNWDSKYHKLRIEPASKDVRIFAQPGYYAFPPLVTPNWVSARQ